MKHNIACKYSRFQLVTRNRPAACAGFFSAGDPPVLSRIPTAFPQGFPQLARRGFRGFSARFSHLLRLVFIANINTSAALFFISFFVRFPRNAEQARPQKIRAEARRNPKSAENGTPCVGNHSGWGSVATCTQNVARGTVEVGRRGDGEAQSLRGAEAQSPRARVGEWASGRVGE